MLYGLVHRRRFAVSAGRLQDQLMRVYVGGVENASFEIIVLLAGMWKPLVRRAVTAAARNKIYPARTC